MRDDRMFAAVSDNGSYGMEFGQESAIMEANRLAEKYPEETFTVYMIGEPIASITIENE